MAKGAYIGVSGVAHKIKKGYIGVGGIARKIKKAYIGINGVARVCWSGGELSYYGTATELSTGRESFGITNVNNTVLIAGGLGNSGVLSSVETYNQSLVKGTASALGYAREDIGSANNSNYAMFVSGRNNSSSILYYIDNYSTSFTRTQTTYRNRTYHICGGKIADYALFAGGLYSDGSGDSYISAYDNALTERVQSKIWLYYAGYGYRSANTDKYCLFAGPNGTSPKVTAVSNTLTRSAPTDLQSWRAWGSAFSVNNYIVFAGGATGGREQNYVDAYDISLTKVTVPQLTQAREYHNSTTVGDYGIVATGNNTNNITEVYDKSLTHSTLNNIPYSYRGGAITIGDYGLVVRGSNTAGKQTTVDVYTIS